MSGSLPALLALELIGLIGSGGLGEMVGVHVQRSDVQAISEG